MARSAPPRDLRKGDKVVASVDLRGVPEGTKGKVALVEGLSWVRYWVRFDNGTAIGSVNRSHLATPEEWTRKLSGVADDDTEPDAAVSSEAEGGAGDGAGGDGVVTANGALVSQKLIDRAKAARARLAG